MAGINQGKPEVAVGEPIRLGSDNDYELEQHPVSDRLIIRDTTNGKVAYVRQERGGQIGGDDALVKALKEGKPLADDGRTYLTTVEAEENATEWMFLPPGNYRTFNVETDGLTVAGCGHGSYVDETSNGRNGINVHADNVTIKDLRVETDSGNTAITCSGNKVLFENVVIPASGHHCIDLNGTNKCRVVNCRTGTTGSGRGVRYGDDTTIIGTTIDSADYGINGSGDRLIAVSNIITNCATDGINTNGPDNLVGGNRIIGSGDNGIQVGSFSGNLVFNNRVSDSTNTDILDNGTSTVLDANVTGASN